MGVNSSLDNEGGLYTITQSTIAYSDSRRWKLNKANQYLVLVPTGGFNTSSLTVRKYNADHSLAGSVTQYTADNISSSEGMTCCIDRKEEYVYVLFYWNFNKHGMVKIKLDDMTVANYYSNTTVSEIPRRAIIAPDGWIWWIGGGRIRRMDTTGENETSAAIAGVLQTFTMDTYGIAYTASDGNVASINSGMIVDTKINPDFPFSSTDHAVDSFALNGSLYFLMAISGNRCFIRKLNPDRTQIVSNAYTGYGITASVAQFSCNGVMENGEYYATFAENSGSDRQRLWRCKLSNLTCQPFRVIDLENGIFEASDDAGKSIQKIVVNTDIASNGDEYGLHTTFKGPTGAV